MVSDGGVAGAGAVFELPVVMAEPMYGERSLSNAREIEGRVAVMQRGQVPMLQVNLRC